VEWIPTFEKATRPYGGLTYRIGHRLVDDYLEFASWRARPNTVRAYAYDLLVFIRVVGKEPTEVTTKDVLDFIVAQRRPRSGVENVVRISDGGSGLSAATIKRRLAAVSSFYGYLLTRGEGGVSENPVPKGGWVRNPVAISQQCELNAGWGVIGRTLIR
jgi:site-specific recombinase XerD